MSAKRHSAKQRVRRVYARTAVAVSLVGLICAASVWAQPPATSFPPLDQNCTVSVLNRNVLVNPDGSWVLPNIPANVGQVKARATCVEQGLTVSGESAFFTVPANGVVNLPPIILGSASQIPTALALVAASTSLTTAGQTSQLTVSATYPDGSMRDVSAGATGTNYTISNPAIAAITADGLVTAVSSGTVLIQASNEGAQGITTVSVVLGGSSHQGIPDSWALTYNLSPTDPTLADEDPDRDGLTNLQEFLLGTNPILADTDGDGLSDGDEVNVYHTNPLLADTDGDRIPDGVEVRTGTNPLDSNSYDLRAATASSMLQPPSFTLTTSVLFPNASQQLTWKVNLIDGKTSLDLTDDPRTHYSSSDLGVCSFSSQAGLVFAGSAGSCVITISQSTLSVSLPGTIQSFTPVELSTLNVPGAVAVDVSGNFAYVAAGSNGLVIVDITDRTHPRTRGTLTGIGDAEGIRATGQVVFIADANGFLRVALVQDPDSPTVSASIPTGGTPIALAVHGGMAAVAAQSGGVALINITDPTVPSLIATFSGRGPALGVDFDPSRGLAAVAMGTAGLQLVDISNAASPQLRGLLPGGDVRRVLLKESAALLADVQRSVTAVDIINPDQPVLASSIPSSLGGVPVDIASLGVIAMTADSTFGRAVPIIDVSNPLQPQTVEYWTLGSAGLSSSIAMDAEFGYLIAGNASAPASQNLLRILQYQNIVDDFGIPPTVQITSPLNGIQMIQGSRLTVTATAADDVGVAAVNFFVNGQSVFTTAASPYEYTFTVPSNNPSLTLGATAVDFGNSVGAAANVTLSVIPDPLTTVVGTVLNANQPVAGVTITCEGHSSVTASDGSFTVSGVPTLQATVCSAQAVVNNVLIGGTSASVPPVRAGTTSLGNIPIGPLPVITSLSTKSALFNTAADLTVAGANLTGATFSLQPSAITVLVTSVTANGTSATVSFNSGAQAGTFALIATNAFGSSATAVTPADRFTVVDPSSTATAADGFPAVIDAAFGIDPLDPNSVPNVNQPTSGEVDITPFSTLNLAGLTGGQAMLLEADALTFSVLNAKGSAATSSAVTEADATPFSALNVVGMTGGQAVGLEVAGVAFSVLNADPTAPLAAQNVDGSGGGGGQGNSGGQTVTREADAVPFSVNNTAAGAPPGPQPATRGLTARAVAARSIAGSRARAVLESRPLFPVGLIVLNTTYRSNYFTLRDTRIARRQP